MSQWAITGNSQQVLLVIVSKEFPTPSCSPVLGLSNMDDCAHYSWLPVKNMTILCVNCCSKCTARILQPIWELQPLVDPRFWFCLTNTADHLVFSQHWNVIPAEVTRVHKELSREFLRLTRRQHCRTWSRHSVGCTIAQAPSLALSKSNPHSPSSHSWSANKAGRVPSIPSQIIVSSDCGLWDKSAGRPGVLLKTRPSLICHLCVELWEQNWDIVNHDCVCQQQNICIISNLLHDPPPSSPLPVPPHPLPAEAAPPPVPAEPAQPARPKGPHRHLQGPTNHTATNTMVANQETKTIKSTTSTRSEPVAWLPTRGGWWGWKGTRRSKAGKSLGRSSIAFWPACVCYHLKCYSGRQ